MIEYGLPFDDYCAIDAVNFSTYLKNMIKNSPLHVKHAISIPSEDTTARLKGRATHALVLEPATFKEHYAVFDVEGKDRRSKEWKEFELANPGKAHLKGNEFRECQRQAAAVRSNNLCKKYLADGAAEVSMIWKDRDTGLTCKARVDWISSSSPALCDVKGVRSLDLRKLQKQADDEGWGNQAMHYVTGYAELHAGTTLPAVMLAHEINPPFDVSALIWDGDSMIVLESENRKAMARIAECKRTDRWPGRHREAEIEAKGELLLRLPAYRFGEQADDIDFSEEDEQQAAAS